MLIRAIPPTHRQRDHDMHSPKLLSIDEWPTTIHNRKVMMCSRTSMLVIREFIISGSIPPKGL
jgi:hypothetical protein